MQVPTLCMLAIQDTTQANQVVVAEGRAHPYPNKVLHVVKMMYVHYKVSLDWPYHDEVNQKLIVPSPDDKMTTIDQAIGHLLMWPVDGIIFKEKEVNILSN